MTWVAAALATSAVLGYAGAKQQAGAATGAAEKQFEASQESIRQQREMFDILNAQQAPYRQAGYGALGRIGEMLPQFTQLPAAYKPFTAEDLKTNLAPNYQFMLQQGLGATRQGMNVASPGSNITTAATKFAEDYASNAYQNALNNYMQQQAQAFNQQQTGLGNVYNRLANIAGIGQAAQQQTQGLGTSTAANIANLTTGGAGALGAGQIGAANAMAGGLQNIGNAGFMYAMLRPQTPQTGSGRYPLYDMYGNPTS